MFDFVEDFNKYKDEILEILISHYGEDKRELITKRFNLIAFDFSSRPTDDYEYALKHCDELNYEDLLLIEEEYIKYKNISLELKQEFINQFSKHLLDVEKLESFTPEDRDLFISLFTDENFSESYIDALTTEKVNMVNNPDTSLIVKNRILNLQMEFFEWLDAFGIEEAYEFLGKVADLIVTYREVYKTNYEISIIKKYKYAGLEIFYDFYQKFHVNLGVPDLRNCFFFDDPFMAPAHTVSKDEDNAFIPKIIKMPVIYHINLGFYNCDVSLIHEIIHAIENDTKKCNIGIHLYKEKFGGKEGNKASNRIANEVRTQMLAIKIVQKLHQKGIFILDSPDNYFIRGGSSYEELIPFAGDFFLEFEKFIMECAINGDIDMLYAGFGDTWNDFSKLLDESFDDYLTYEKFVGDSINLTIQFDNYDYLFVEMRNCYYQSYENEIITKKRKI